MLSDVLQSGLGQNTDSKRTLAGVLQENPF